MVAYPDIFSVLANPVRRRILELLLEEPSTVNGLVARFDLHRPAVSEHLQVLRNARLVRDEKQGRTRLYSVQPSRLREVAEWIRPFERYWQERLQQLEDVLEQEQVEDNEQEASP